VTTLYSQGIGVRDLERLIDAARAGDPEAVGVIFDRYYDAIYRYAFARLGRVSDAEDAAGEVFVSVVASLPMFRWRGVPFEAWLFRIAASKVVDVARRRTSDNQRATVVVEPSDGDSRDPSEVVERLEDHRRLAAAIERLPHVQRDVLLLRFFLDRPIRDVAATLGRSEGAVKQLQFRAMRRLRRLLERTP
jgi:RNA polymerase sigma-70 factor (ECF subfamily)